MLLLFAACEREEYIVRDDGQRFCPLLFDYQQYVLLDGGCGEPPNIAATEPLITTDANGLLLTQNLYRNRMTHFARMDTTVEIQQIYHPAHHFLKNNTFRFEFKKVEMAPGTRIALFAAPTRKINDAPTYLMSSSINDEASLYLYVFIERDVAGDYYEGYKLKYASEVRRKFQLSDFSEAQLYMRWNESEGITLSSTLSNQGTKYLFDGLHRSALLEQEMKDIPPFVGLALRRTAESNSTCASRKIALRPVLYEFISSGQIEQIKFVCDHFFYN